MSPYPKFVWTPTGGWYCDPPNWRKNTGLAMIFVLASSGLVWYISAQLEVSHPVLHFVMLLCCTLLCCVDMYMYTFFPCHLYTVMNVCIIYFILPPQRRPVPPYRFIPSQIWCKYAAVRFIFLIVCTYYVLLKSKFHCTAFSM